MIDSLDSINEGVKTNSSKTVRISIDLNRSDDFGNPVYIFNYKELLKAEQEKLTIPQSNFNANSDDEEALKKIALQYEEKYGGSSNMRYHTYSELGAGYDENDSFIDNTEACEEEVPDNHEPVHGGFYVNEGKLEFKLVDDDSNRIKRKRMLECERNEEELPMYLKNRRRSRSNSLEKQEESQSKVIKKAHKSIRKNNIKCDGEAKSTSTSKNNIKCEGEAKSTTTSKITMKKYKRKDTLAVGDRRNDELQKGFSANVENESNDTNAAAISISENGDSAKMDGLNKGEVPPTLPNVPPSFLPKLKSIVCELRDQDQNKIFNNKTYPLLRRFECCCRKDFSRSVRDEIYSYLAHFIPCSKSTLEKNMEDIFTGISQLKGHLARITKIVSSFDNLTEKCEQRKSLEDTKKHLEKVMQIKVRQFVTTNIKKRGSLKLFIKNELLDLVGIWPSGTVTTQDFLEVLNETIGREAKKFNLTYSSRSQISPSLPPGCSSDVQMQLDQVLQDLVALSQMSSDAVVSTSGT